jgi:hypothetical protein
VWGRPEADSLLLPAIPKQRVAVAGSTRAAINLSVETDEDGRNIPVFPEYVIITIYGIKYNLCK